MPPVTPNQGRTATASDPSTTSEGSYSVAQASGIAPELASGGVAYAREDVAHFAEAIKRADMTGPALIALRIAGPLSWIGGQMLWAVQPIVQGLRVGPARTTDAVNGGIGGIVTRLAHFLEGDGNVAELVAHLEADSLPRARKRKWSRNSRGKDNGPV